ncbi:MAG: 30S ribosome-binding factor RbfA [Treponema sp.]
MSEHRIERLQEQLREEISRLISSHRIKDKRVGSFLSINRVVISSDLAYAKVYVSSFMDEHVTKQGVAGLDHAKGFIRSSLAKILRIRKTPELSFIYDKSIKEGQDIIRLINSLDIPPEDDELPSGVENIL